MACKKSYEKSLAVCTAYRDNGYNACAQYRDNGYNACSQYRDNGYNACSQYRDNGYNSCSDWRKNCCDWWPCSWICEVVSWFCFAWVWISNIVCVAWIWITNLVCVAWVWISSLVCVAWIWITSLVCIAWTLITVTVTNIWCAIICFLKRLFSGNEVSESKSECTYGWTAAYRMDENKDCRLNVTLRIKLEPEEDVTAEEVQNAKDRWEPAIEAAWTNKFPIVKTDGDCACKRYSVNVDVQFVENNEHHIVRIERGPGRANMGRWFHDSTGGTAAHESGHMFGNPDEYADANCPNRVATTDGSIMQNSQTGVAKERHYQQFADWISARSCCDYVVGHK